MRNYPSVLIGRLAVDNQFKGKGIGKELMNFIKIWFASPENKTGCRFIVVDAYNKEDTIAYYQRNEFSMLFSTEEQEKEYLFLEGDMELKTRLLYFDLLDILEQRR